MCFKLPEDANNVTSKQSKQYPFPDMTLQLCITDGRNHSNNEESGKKRYPILYGVSPLVAQLADERWHSNALYVRYSTVWMVSHRVLHVQVNCTAPAKQHF